MKQNILSPSQCDAAVTDFTSFCSNEFKKFRVEFEEFKEESDRLDNFFFQKVNIQNYKALRFVVKLGLTLSHGQSSVERQLSVNNQVLDNNMQMMSIVAQKHIINHMKAIQLTPHSIDISKDLLLSVNSASTRYGIYLEEESKKKADNEAENQKAIISNNMAKLKDQCDPIKRAITMMEQDVSECMLLAESNKDLEYIVKSNALKRKCDESKKILELLEEQYSALAEKKKKL